MKEVDDFYFSAWRLAARKVIAWRNRLVKRLNAKVRELEAKL